MKDNIPPPEGEPIALPIDGALDLHTFRPSELGSLIPAWLFECQKAGLTQVRIIHGKGTGALRASVEAILKRTPTVVSFGTAPPELGGWGATLVTISSNPLAGGT